MGVFILVGFFCMYFFPGSIWQLSVQEKQMLKPNNLKIYANVENKLLNTWQILTLRANTKTVNNNNKVQEGNSYLADLLPFLKYLINVIKILV